MTCKRFAQLLRGRLAIILLPLLCLAYAPDGLAQASTNTAVAQVLTPKEFGESIERAKKLDDIGDYGEAVSIWMEIVSTAEKVLGKNHPYYSELLDYLGESCRNQGWYEEAEKIHKKALDLRIKFLGPSHPNTSESLHSLALLYADKGMYVKAEELYLRSLEIEEKVFGLKHRNTVATIENLGVLYLHQGEYAKSELYLKKAEKLSMEIYGPDYPGMGGLLSNLSQVYRGQGQMAKAEKILLNALKLDEKYFGSEHPNTATTLNNLALIYRDLGFYDKAAPLYFRSLDIRRKVLGDDHPLTLDSMNNLAVLSELLGLDKVAEDLYRQALGIEERKYGENSYFSWVKMNNLGQLLVKRRLYRQAQPLLEKSLAIAESIFGSNHRNALNSQNNLGYLYYEQGLNDKADRLLRRALSTQTLLVQREASYMPRADRQAFVSSLEWTDAVYSYAQWGSGGARSALFSRLNRQGLLEEIEKRQSQLASLPGEQQQVAEELRALTQQLSSLTIKPVQRKALRERQEKLEKQLYRLLPQLEPRVVEVEQVAAALPSEGVLIEFQRYRPFDGKKPEGERWGSARYVAMILKPNGSVTVVDLGDAEVLDQAITSAVSTARQAQADAVQKFELVSQLLLEPLKQATARSKTWFVSPDGELNRLPFSALPAPGGKGYLTEAVDLRLLTTGRELLDLQQPKQSAKSVALVVADPAYDRSGGGASKPVPAKDRNGSNDSHQRSSDLSEELKWDRLPETAKEGVAVKALTGGSLLVQKEATAEAVKGTPAPKILHLATHAFYLPNQPQQQPESGAGLLNQRGSRGVVQASSLQGESPLLRSGIALAGANQPNADPKDDGYLTALEVAQLSLEGTDLVVISACESGLGDLQVGEGVYGLKRAIAVAGAKSSLLSLWKVDDYATKAFMEGFYGRLKEGQGKAEALAETQKQFRESPPRDHYRHPYYWAAFQLSGDWGSVKGL